jgi:hypothetical protein
MTEYKFFSDPGHGWLEVPVAEVRRLGIADKVSAYSYRKGDNAYLEEDCDAGLWLDAKKAAGEEYKICEINSNYDSFIRACGRF